MKIMYLSGRTATIIIVRDTHLHISYSEKIFINLSNNPIYFNNPVFCVRWWVMGSNLSFVRGYRGRSFENVCSLKEGWQNI